MLICIQDCGVIVLFCKWYVTRSRTVNILKIYGEIVALLKVGNKSTGAGICLQQV